MGVRTSGLYKNTRVVIDVRGADSRWAKAYLTRWGELTCVLKNYRGCLFTIFSI